MEFNIKKWLFYGLLFLLGLFAAKIAKQYKKKTEVIEQRETLPVLNFKGLNGKLLQVEENRSVGVIYFHPDCDYCRHEMDYIREHIDQLRGSELVLISSAEAEYTRAFLAEKGLDQYANIKVGIDEGDQFSTTFGTRMIPAIFIYDAQHELVKFFKGETRIETIIKYLNEDA